MGIFYIRTPLPELPSVASLPPWLTELYQDRETHLSAGMQLAVAGLVCRESEFRHTEAFTRSWIQGLTRASIDLAMILARGTIYTLENHPLVNPGMPPQSDRWPETGDLWLEERDNLHGILCALLVYNRRDSVTMELIDPSHREAHRIAGYSDPALELQKLLNTLDHKASDYPIWRTAPAQTERLQDVRNRRWSWVQSYPLLDTETTIYPEGHQTAAQVWAALYARSSR